MPTPDLLPRDVAILRHLARNRIGLRAVLAKLFFDGGDPGRVLGLLAKRGLVKVDGKSLAGGFVFVTLTPAGYAALGLGVNKRACDPIGPAALSKAVAMEMGCAMGAYPRHRLTRHELVTAFGPDAPPDNVFHVASDELGWPVIFRVVFATSADQRQVERLRRHVEEAKRNDSIRPWLLDGDYGFLVLVPWPGKIEALREAIAKSSVGKDYVVVVDVGPTAETLATTLRKKE